ncbi:phosphodiesterase [Robbsia sp. KACC 23696]|uniref:phosphodiesterase n=1 Tax=Robbsia sp. KACC 23696 TaxID=3149231 RepID=UPI00325B012D
MTMQQTTTHDVTANAAQQGVASAAPSHDPRLPAHAPFYFVQLTDLHIRAPGVLAYRKVDTAVYLRQAVAHVLSLDPAPAAVVVTGDLVDKGSVEEYMHLQALLAPLPMPIYMLVGNHDGREGLRAVFDAPYLREGGAFVQYTADIGGNDGSDGKPTCSPVRLIALDTLEPGRSGGFLCAQRLDWFEAALEDARGLPVVVALHHPPFATGIGHMDEALLDAASSARLAEIVARHPNVERIIAGHLHREIHARFGGTIVSTAGSTAHQVCLDLRDDAPSAFTMEPPTAVIHRWQPAPGLPADPRSGLGGGLVSHLSYLATYDGPYPFHEPDGGLIDR